MSGPPAKFDAVTAKNAKTYYNIDYPTQLSVEQLDWRDYKLDNLPRVDVIVASDIVFAKELHNCLANLLRDLLSCCTSSDQAAYIACTKRADGMVSGFLEVYRKHISELTCSC